ncbi:hypothetical protein D3C75_572080 [compost metagenome]
MALNLTGSVACFIGHFKVVHGSQLFDGFNELELVVVHQKVDGVAVRATAEAVVELFFTVHGERGGFFVMERTARVVILALLFQLNPCVDEINDIGSCQQVIDKYARNSSSHRPHEFLVTHKRK